jgi:hypothetical protein
MFKIKKFGFNTVKIIIYSIVAVFIIGSAVYAVYFLYNNFYRTIVYINNDEFLKNDPAIRMVDMERFEEIKRTLEKKKEVREIDISMDFY